MFMYLRLDIVVTCQDYVVTDLFLKAISACIAQDLGLGYLDLYLIHWPHAFKRGDDPFPKDAEGNMVYDDQHFVDTWKGMLESRV